MFLYHYPPRNLCISQAGHVNKCQFLLFPNDHRTLLFPLVNSDFPSIAARTLQDNNRACGCYLELTLCSLSSIFVVNCLSSRCRRTNLKPDDSFFLFIFMAQAGFAVDASHFKTSIVVVDCVCCCCCVACDESGCLSSSLVECISWFLCTWRLCVWFDSSPCKKCFVCLLSKKCYLVYTI